MNIFLKNELENVLKKHVFRIADFFSDNDSSQFIFDEELSSEHLYQ